jgi:chemotaxis protein methyltransferase CheR
MCTESTAETQVILEKPINVFGRYEVRPMSAREFSSIRQLAYETCGIDFAESKKEMVASRLDRLLRKLNLSSFEDYYAHVQDDASGVALREFIDALATNHTGFLREADHFSFLREQFGGLIVRGRPIRIWSAACSTGEEPYSIAMTMLDQRRHELVPAFQILATDISTRALAAAKSGIYSGDRLRGLPPGWSHEFFEMGRGKWTGWMRIKPAVRKTIEFNRFNLLDTPTDPNLFDVIFCRNVMLYFDRSTQEAIVNRLTGRLDTGGYLLIGHTESLMGIRHRLDYIQPAVYRKLT